MKIVRSFRRISIAGAFFAAATACQGRSVEPAAGLLISNVRVFDVANGTFSEPMGILIREGRIHGLGATDQLAVSEEEIDARGGFAVPGLWDCHVHLSALHLGGPDSVRSGLENFVQSGVLYVRDVGGPLDLLAAMRDRVRAGELVGPEIFFSGPMAERPPLYWAGLNEQLPGCARLPVKSGWTRWQSRNS